MSQQYRIHGDNIMECEVALSIIVESFKSSGLHIDQEPKVIQSRAFAPKFQLIVDGSELTFEFFPGHGRWDISLSEYTASQGAQLREAVDAFVTKLENNEEVPVGAFEFCSALPAGNNAWQRTGRALSMISAGIPYFYFADIGGQELDSDRNIKAPRFPNPIVPFSYLAATSSSSEQCSTIYLPSPSISETTFAEFKDSFGNSEYKKAIASLFDFPKAQNADLDSSRIKSANFVLDLVKRRRANNTYSQSTWGNMLEKASHALPIADLMKNNSLAWSKRISIPSTQTLPKLINTLKNIGVHTIGSSDMPFCLLPSVKRDQFVQQLQKLYGNSISSDLLEKIQNGNKDIVITFIAGFKPRGDDSRPDRGLTPLARMIFANDDVEYLSIVYGPASRGTWNRLFENPHQLSHTNGLWESIVGLSDYIIVDSLTLDTEIERRDLIIGNDIKKKERIKLQEFSPIPRFGEHDVDSALHLLFSRSESNGVYESLCNPPGGDWSGISIIDDRGNTARWTSLPRVTGVNGKRPDHIIQFINEKIILSIESKDHLANLESGIGPRLNQYTMDLLSTGLAQAKKLKDSVHWTQLIDIEALKNVTNEYSYFSAAAFMCRDDSTLEEASSKSDADIVIGFKFNDDKTTLYVKTRESKIQYIFLAFLKSQQQKLATLNIEVSLLN